MSNAYWFLCLQNLVTQTRASFILFSSIGDVFFSKFSIVTYLLQFLLLCGTHLIGYIKNAIRIKTLKQIT